MGFADTAKKEKHCAVLLVVSSGAGEPLYYAIRCGEEKSELQFAYPVQHQPYDLNYVRYLGTRQWCPMGPSYPLRGPRSLNCSQTTRVLPPFKSAPNCFETRSFQGDALEPVNERINTMDEDGRPQLTGYTRYVIYFSHYQSEEVTLAFSPKDSANW